MQLAKNLYTTSEQTWQRKLHDIVLAGMLEWHYSKGTIMELYLNRVYLGPGVYGISNGAEFYFGVPATKMTKAQLVDENIALRHNLALLEQQVADLANQLVAAKGAANIKRKPQPGGEVVVATYTKRDGSHWNKVRTGWNQFTHRQAA